MKETTSKTHSVNSTFKILNSTISQENKQESPAQKMNISSMNKRGFSLSNQGQFFVHAYCTVLYSNQKNIHTYIYRRRIVGRRADEIKKGAGENENKTKSEVRS